VKLDQEFWDCLSPKVKEMILHVAKHPTERNTCYAAGYIRGAKEAGGLLNQHYSVLLTLLWDKGELPDWHATVKGFR
jgi:hypothetical protein